MSKTFPVFIKYKALHYPISISHLNQLLEFFLLIMDLSLRALIQSLDEDLDLRLLLLSLQHFQSCYSS
jgi:hypothetical protein